MLLWFPYNHQEFEIICIYFLMFPFICIASNVISVIRLEQFTRISCKFEIMCCKHNLNNAFLELRVFLHSLHDWDTSLSSAWQLHHYVFILSSHSWYHSFLRMISNGKSMNDVLSLGYLGTPLLRHAWLIAIHHIYIVVRMILHINGVDLHL